MFTKATEAELIKNLPAENGQPWHVVLSAEVYRELVIAARQFNALRPESKTVSMPNYQYQLTPVGAGDGETYVVR